MNTPPPVQTPEPHCPLSPLPGGEGRGEGEPSPSPNKPSPTRRAVPSPLPGGEGQGEGEPSSATNPPSPKRRGFRLFKRDDHGRELAPEAPGWKERFYYFKFAFHGTRYVRCLETTDATKAQTYARAKAKEIKDAIVHSDHQRLQATKLRATSTATVAELFSVYDRSAVDAGTTTRTQNKHALRQLLRDTLPAGAATPVETLSISYINAPLARQWFQRASALALAAPDQAAQLSLKKSANSRFVQAKSLFTPRALAAYRDARVYHPGLEEFAAAGDVAKFSRIPKTSYNPPSDTIITKTLAAWEALHDHDRNLFLAIGHELAFGLRIAEMAQATWSWWSTREGYPVLDGTGSFKNGTALIQVRALDPWYTLLRQRIDAKQWRTEPADFILTGTPTDRADNIFRAVSDWLRHLGWQTKKTNHALRAYAGSQIAMRYGIYEAQCWLRHSTVKVTEQNYSHFIQKFKPANVEVLPARWATAAPAAPILRLLESASAS